MRPTVQHPTVGDEGNRAPIATVWAAATSHGALDEEAPIRG